MDKYGNIAVGYSVSSSTMNPSIFYAGRAPGDPLGTLGPETSIIGGTGSQTIFLGRWGDYTSLSLDPVDDCTFWYTGEYLKSNGTFNWSTRIASFRFPECAGGTPSPDFSISASPASQTVSQGAGTSYSTTITSIGGFNGTVNLGVTGLPSGATGSFSPTSVTGSGSSTLTITTSSSSLAGTYTLTITGTSGTTTHATTVTLVVNAVTSGDFTISATPASRTISRASTTTYTVTVSPSGGFSAAVGLSVSGLPKGATASFNPTSIASGSGSSTLTVTAGRGANAAGTSTLTIKGTSGSLVHSATVTLVVTQ